MMIKGMTVVNSWIETSAPSVAPSISVKRAATAAAGAASCGHPPAAGSAPRAADGRPPVSLVRSYVGELLERPAHNFTPRRGSTSCGAATLAPGQNPPGISFVDDPGTTPLTLS